MSITMTVDRWGSADGDQSVEVRLAREADLLAAIRMLAHDHSSMITLLPDESQPVWLAVEAYDGLFSVTVQFPDRAFDLVGNPEATGYLPFVSGGQRVSYPQRYLVTIHQAITAATTPLRHLHSSRPVSKTLGDEALGLQRPRLEAHHIPTQCSLAAQASMAGRE